MFTNILWRALLKEEVHLQAKVSKQTMMIRFQRCLLNIVEYFREVGLKCHVYPSKSNKELRILFRATSNGKNFKTSSFRRGKKWNLNLHVVTIMSCLFREKFRKLPIIFKGIVSKYEKHFRELVCARPFKKTNNLYLTIQNEYKAYIWLRYNWASLFKEQC